MILRKNRGQTKPQKTMGSKTEEQAWPCYRRAQPCCKLRRHTQPHTVRCMTVCVIVHGRTAVLRSGASSRVFLKRIFLFSRGGLLLGSYDYIIPLRLDQIRVNYCKICRRTDGIVRFNDKFFSISLLFLFSSILICQFRLYVAQMFSFVIDFMFITCFYLCSLGPVW